MLVAMLSKKNSRPGLPVAYRLLLKIPCSCGVTAKPLKGWYKTWAMSQDAYFSMPETVALPTNACLRNHWRLA